MIVMSHCTGRLASSTKLKRQVQTEHNYCTVISIRHPVACCCFPCTFKASISTVPWRRTGEKATYIPCDLRASSGALRTGGRPFRHRPTVSLLIAKMMTPKISTPNATMMIWRPTQKFPLNRRRATNQRYPLHPSDPMQVSTSKIYPKLLFMRC